MGSVQVKTELENISGSPNRREMDLLVDTGEL